MSISWAEGPGALWYNNPIVIHPRFELRLKVIINKKGCKDGLSWAMDGFTIILTKSKDQYLGGGGENLGYDGIYNALVTEIDLFQNQGDIGSNSVSIHRCYNNYCRSTEGSNTSQANLPFNYDKCREMVYDVYIQYKNKVFSVFVNDSPVISSSESLLDNFDGWAYMGFSGFFRGYVRELFIDQSSFFCLDTIQDIYFDTIVNGITYPNNSIPQNIPAGAPIQVIAKFSDFDKLFVPHLYGDNVTNWQLTISYDCGLTTFNWKSFIYVDKTNIQNLVISLNFKKIFILYNYDDIYKLFQNFFYNSSLIALMVIHKTINSNN